MANANSYVVNATKRKALISYKSGSHISLSITGLQTEYQKHCRPSKIPNFLLSIPVVTLLFNTVNRVAREPIIYNKQQ